MQLTMLRRPKSTANRLIITTSKTQTFKPGWWHLATVTSTPDACDFDKKTKVILQRSIQRGSSSGHRLAPFHFQFIWDTTHTHWRVVAHELSTAVIWTNRGNARVPSTNNGVLLSRERHTFVVDGQFIAVDIT